MLDGGGFILRGDRFFNGNDVHTDAVTAGRDQMGLAFERKEGHLVKAVGQLGIFFDLPEDHVGHFGNAGNKQLDVPLLFVVGVFIVVLDNAVVGGVGEQFNDALFGFAGELGDLRGGLGFAKFHFQHDFSDLVAGACTVKDNVLRIGLGQLFDAKLIRETVRDHFAEIKQNLSCHSVFPPSICLSLFIKKCIHF